jgi:hypothetical protein
VNSRQLLFVRDKHCRLIARSVSITKKKFYNFDQVFE